MANVFVLNLKIQWALSLKQEDFTPNTKKVKWHQEDLVFNFHQQQPPHLVTKPSAVAKNCGSPSVPVPEWRLSTDFSSHKMHSPVGHVIISPLSRNKGKWEISALAAREGLQGLLITGKTEDVAPSRSGPHVHLAAC